MKPGRPMGSPLPVWGLSFLAPLILISCRTALAPTGTPTPFPVVIADPSAQAIVARLLSINASVRPASTSVGPGAVQAIPQSALNEELQSGEAQLAFGLGAPPEGLWAAQLGWEGILVIVRPGNPIRSISLTQLGEVFSGKITSWSALGSGAGAIHLVGREKGSPVRLAFDHSVLANDLLSSEALMASASWAVVQAVHEDPLAIGYLPCIDLASGLRALQIDGVAPRGETIQMGEYPLRIPVVAIARQQPQGTWASFVAWAQAEQGQQAFRMLCQP